MSGDLAVRRTPPVRRFAFNKTAADVPPVPESLLEVDPPDEHPDRPQVRAYRRLPVDCDDSEMPLEQAIDLAQLSFQIQHLMPCQPEGVPPVSSLILDTQRDIEALGSKRRRSLIYMQDAHCLIARPRQVKRIQPTRPAPAGLQN